MPDLKRYPLLAQIETPTDLRLLSRDQLPELASELRDFMIHSVASTGGHLAAGLGTVEITIALHYVFDTPNDELVWDVGHQTYPHKILTGRRDRMASLRQQGGLSGFPKRNESPYDSFGVGHSSTSISAALGMALANQRKGNQKQVIAIIGDGAMTAGMAFEALNHAGDLDSNMLVILNDNDMSIGESVGGLSRYTGRILASKLYTNIRESGKKVLNSLPSIKAWSRRAEEHMKGMVVPGTLFEELGFNYIGPIDGHDLPDLVRTLETIKSIGGPRFLHIITTKGKGYAPAEADPCAYHGVTRFNARTGQSEKKSEPSPNLSYTQVFGQWLCEMAGVEPDLVAITPAMREGSGMVEFSRQYPDRFYDVGIAEQHAVTLAAGFASNGMKPVVAIYSTFLQRAYDQLIHDVALQNLPVVFAIDRAGLVGPDGPTHAGSFDLSFMRCIPNMTIMAPANEAECHRMLTTAFRLDSPSAVRYPRGAGPGSKLPDQLEELPVGKAEVVRNGTHVALLVFGSMLETALQVAEQLNATVINMRFIKPLDTALITELASHHSLLATLEENTIAGGAGSAVSEFLAEQNMQVNCIHFGLPDAFVEHGSREQLLDECGLSVNAILEQLKSAINSRDCNSGSSQLIS